MSDNCGDCRFCSATAGLGYCKRHAPVVHTYDYTVQGDHGPVLRSDGERTVWPMVSTYSGWCGDFERKDDG